MVVGFLDNRESNDRRATRLSRNVSDEIFPKIRRFRSLCVPSPPQPPCGCSNMATETINQGEYLALHRYINQPLFRVRSCLRPLSCESSRCKMTITSTGGPRFNRTYGTHKKTIYLAIFTNKIWSYLLWSPVTGHKVVSSPIHTASSGRLLQSRH